MCYHQWQFPEVLLTFLDSGAVLPSATLYPSGATPARSVKGKAIFEGSFFEGLGGSANLKTSGQTYDDHFADQWNRP